MTIRRTTYKTFALILLIILAGCGKTHTQYRVGLVNTDTKWKEDAAEKIHRLGVPEAKGEYIYFPVHERYRERKYSFTVTQHEQKVTKEPDLFFTIATAGMFCLFLDESCFGRWGSWERNGDPVRSGDVATATVRVNDRINTSQVSALVSWTGYGDDQRILGSSEKQIKGVSSIEVAIRGFAEALVARPAQVDVRVSLPTGTGTVTHSMRSTDLERLKLYSERWLPVEERIAIYSRQLRECLMSYKWADANLVFAKLEGLNSTMPDSFFYHYGASLVKSGEVEKGQGYLQRYLNQAGTEGDYNEKAQQMLGGKKNEKK